MLKAGWIRAWAVRDGKYAIAFTSKGDLHAMTFRELEKHLTPTPLEMKALRRLMACNQKSDDMID